jgi:hypothetical protein
MAHTVAPRYDKIGPPRAEPEDAEAGSASPSRSPDRTVGQRSCRSVECMFARSTFRRCLPPVGSMDERDQYGSKATGLQRRHEALGALTGFPFITGVAAGEPTETGGRPQDQILRLERRQRQDRTGWLSRTHRSVHLALSAPTMRRCPPWWKIIKFWGRHDRGGAVSVSPILLPLAIAAVTAVQGPLDGQDARTNVNVQCLQEERDVERV